MKETVAAVWSERQSLLWNTRTHGNTTSSTFSKNCTTLVIIPFVYSLFFTDPLFWLNLRGSVYVVGNIDMKEIRLELTVFWCMRVMKFQQEFRKFSKFTRWYWMYFWNCNIAFVFYIRSKIWASHWIQCSVMQHFHFVWLTHIQTHSTHAQTYSNCKQRKAINAIITICIWMDGWMDGGRDGEIALAQMKSL